MTLEELISRKRAALAPQLAQRDTARATLAAVRTACETDNGRAPTDDEARQVSEARATIDRVDRETAAALEEIRGLEAELESDRAADELARQVNPGAERPAYDRTARIGAEPRTYSRAAQASGEVSFFQDAFNAERGNMRARERLERNATEAIREGEISERAVTTGGFGGLVVPQYLVDLAARVIRAGRPVANAMTPLELPSQGMTLTVPRGTTGAAVAAQATENTAVQSTDEVWANLTIPVVTIAGQQDVSRQSLERGTPGIDEIVYLDLAGAYHAELDRQVAIGSGASGQMLGILSTAGINAATAFGAVVTFANFNSKLAGQIAAVAGVGAGVEPQLIAMHPRRWGWLTAQVDGSGRPLIVPTAQAPFNAGGINVDPGGYGGDNDPGDLPTQIVGSLQGLPVTTDANIPTNQGTLNEDVVLVIDPRHGLLWEDGDRQPKQLRFEQTLGNQLTVKLVIYSYAAFTAGRYPTAFGKIGGLDATAGQGLIAPTF